MLDAGFSVSGDTENVPIPREGLRIAFHNGEAGAWRGKKSAALFIPDAQKQSLVRGNVIRRAMRDAGIQPLNAAALAFLLENQKRIPGKWTAYTHIFFWGTLYQGEEGTLYVSYLCRMHGIHSQEVLELDRYFNGLFPAAVPN